MRTNIKNILGLVLVALLLLSGCASLSDERMIPDMESITFSPSDTTISVIILKGNMVDNGDAEFYENNLDDAILEKAVKKTIEDSGIFRKITTPESSSFELIVKNKRHNVRSSYDMTGHSLITIEYTLKDKTENSILWHEEISSVGRCTIKEAYNTFKRHNTATERAVKKNLLKSIQAISEHVQEYLN